MAATPSEKPTSRSTIPAFTLVPGTLWSRNTASGTFASLTLEYNRETGEKHSGSVYAFIDATNGDVLKAASYKTPAKQSRGNIFDEHNGLKAMGPHGTAYLR
jgi:hypothetical protein